MTPNQRFTFTSHSGRAVTVTAPDEATARAAAMATLWGPLPTSMGYTSVASRSPIIVAQTYQGPYVGYGLTLAETA